MQKKNGEILYFIKYAMCLILDETKERKGCFFLTGEKK